MACRTVFTCQLSHTKQSISLRISSAAGTNVSATEKEALQVNHTLVVPNQQNWNDKETTHEHETKPPVLTNASIDNYGDTARGAYRRA